MPKQKKQKSRSDFWDKVIFEIKDWLFWIAAAVIAASIIGNVLNFLLGNTTPAVGVLSGSMVHDRNTAVSHYQWLNVHVGITKEVADRMPLAGGFVIGDGLIIQGAKEEDLKVGDIIVFHVPLQRTPIIHRIVQIRRTENGTVFVTKGDHNSAADPELWWPGYDDIEGRAILKIPLLGYVKVIPEAIIAFLTGKRIGA